MQHPQALPIDKILRHFQTNHQRGLTTQARADRMEKYGPNALPEQKKPSLLLQVWEQLSNPIVMLLLGTAFIAGVTGEIFESVLIFGIVFLMTAIGIFLEKQSEKSLSKLNSLQTTTSTVLIDGKTVEVASESVVPGDILFLQEGDIIPADARVIESNDAQTDEAALTGESLPVSKITMVLKEDTPLAEQKNMIFSGTSIIEGSLRAVVVRTGQDTEVGKIATYLQQAEKSLTPLQEELEKVGKFLLVATLISVAAILSIYIYRGKPFIESLLATTSLAIAFIPEGLSAVLTITLALAVSEMVKKKVVVKKLVAAEGLGSITHIATDKTGTITEGRMHVAKVFLGNQLFNVDDAKLKKQLGYTRLIDVIRFCNNNKGPTEQALVHFLGNHGFNYELEGRRVEHRFSSALKRMSVIREHQGKLQLFSKGAPDVLIPMCSFVFDKSVKKFLPIQQKEALKAAEKLAGQGFRVLALADKVSHPGKHSHDRQKSESELCFIGLVALMDPLRTTVKETVEGMRAAGITPLVISGDHPAIAYYIAHQSGIAEGTSQNEVLTGAQLDHLFAKSVLSENRQKLLAAKVFARVRPEHKVMLVDFYQREGFRVGMAGDGVNDAAAIKKANIGIAMSNGTGLTKDIADVVITGTYDALLRAVSIGRTVMLRTQLYLHYLLSGNACEVSIFFLAVILDAPMPLTPVMLLLINLLTDALPAIAMAVEPEDPQLLKQKISKEKQQILSAPILRGIGVQAILSTIVLGGVFWFFLPQGAVIAQTVVFTLYIFQKALRGFTARSFTRSVFEYGFFTNKLMNMALLIVVAAWAGIVLGIPEVFGMTRLPSAVIGQLFAFALIMPIGEELSKLLNRKLSVSHQIGN